MEENGQKEQTTESPIRRLFFKFSERTSIPGVLHVRESKSRFRKLGWMIFLIFGLSMAIYQSRDLINEYQKHSTFIVRTEKGNSHLRLPVITFCPEMPILWETAKRLNHRAYNITKSIFEKISEFTQHQSETDYIWSSIMLNTVANLTQEERSQVVLNFRNYFVIYFNANFRQLPRHSPRFKEFYIPLMGNCFTFDPVEERKSGTAISLDFVVYLNKKEIPPNAMFEAETKVFFHAPDTSPPLFSLFLSPNNFVTVKPQQHLQATFSLTELNRLPAPYPSNCVDSEDIFWRSKNPFFTNKTFYLYTKEHCQMKSLGIDYTTIDDYATVSEVLPREDGKCPPPCHELQYDWKPLITTFHSTFLDKTLLYFFEAESKNLSKLDFTFPNITFEEFKSGVSVFQFYAAPATYTSFSEKPKYTLGDLLGAIGGNLGLWIGMSIVSFIELFDFVMNLISRSCKFLWRKITNKKANNYV